MVVALQLGFQSLGDIDVLRLVRRQLLGDLLVDVLRRDVQLLAPRVVVERHRRAVVHRTLEIVSGHVVPEHLFRQFVTLEERRSRESDVTRVRQGVAHVERQEPVLRPVRLVGNHDHVVACRVRLAGTHLLVELLDEREDMALVLTKKRLQMRPARGSALVLVVIDNAAPGERLVDLRVEFVAVGQNQEREVAADLAVNLSREIDHRITLARSLRVPEHAQLAVRGRAVFHRLHRAVHAEELVVAGENLRNSSRRFVIDDEILEEVEQIRLGTRPLQQRLHVHRTRIIFGKTLPGVEELELGGVGANLRVDAVCENHERVEVEDLRHDLAVVAEVVAVGNGDILRDVLQLHEDERHAVHEPHDIRAAATAERTAQPQLAHAKEVVVRWRVKVEDAQVYFLLRTIRRRVANGNAIEQELVFLAVEGVEARGDICRGKNADTLLVCFSGEPRIELFKCGTQIAHQQHLALVNAPQRPRRTEDLLHGVDARVPAERSDQILRRRLLHQIVFGVRVHVADSVPWPARSFATCRPFFVMRYF